MQTYQEHVVSVIWIQLISGAIVAMDAWLSLQPEDEEAA